MFLMIMQLFFLRKEISSEIFRVRTTKIKSVILEIGNKYPRLEFLDIKEKCEENEELISC